VRLTDSAGSTFEDTVDDGVVLFMSDEPVAMPMRVKMAQTRAFHMPLHHLHLVPEHQELDCPSHPAGDSGSEQTGDEEVHEREQHGAPSGRRERMLLVALGAGLGFLNPSRSQRA
jgi:hypothetical protein